MPDLIQDESLINFVRGLDISEADKDFLISGIPDLDINQRKDLLKTLIKVKLLDSEEKKILDKIGEFWEMVSK